MRMIIYGGSIPAGRGVMRPLGIEVIDMSLERSTKVKCEKYKGRGIPLTPAISGMGEGIRNEAYSPVPFLIDQMKTGQNRMP